MVTPEERREAKKSLIKNGVFLLGFVALLVVITVAVFTNDAVALAQIVGPFFFLAFVLGVLYLLVRFIKWAATRK